MDPLYCLINGSHSWFIITYNYLFPGNNGFAFLEYRQQWNVQFQCEVHIFSICFVNDLHLSLIFYLIY